MSTLSRRAWRALTMNAAETSPDSDDPRLRGRTYAVPFDTVWRGACALVDGGLPHCRLLESDDYQGSIRGETEAYLAHPSARLNIRVVLDENAQTRVDARAGSPGRRTDWGANARLIGRFFDALDAALEDGREDAAGPARSATRVSNGSGTAA